jgi:acetoin utilization protein AcuC
VAHRWCDGRWLATGGGGYDAYRVVPRAWAIVWLQQAHRELPVETPVEWRERWTDAAEAFGQAPLPGRLLDPPGSVEPDPEPVVRRNRERAEISLAEARRLLGGRPGAPASS